jgi:BirA family biotin operon repressor/biotin-[acetyl-CoA-carboxylase] ligase
MFALNNKINLFGLMATLFVGQNKIFIPEVDSTNSYATTLLKNVNPIEGTVIYADHQTKGKGQRGNHWESKSSMNLTLSVILKPTFLNAKKTFYLSKITALALHDVLSEITRDSQFDIKIKWPNDILVNTKKIAGVLIENGFKEDRVSWSVIGIGLNVNQKHFENETATSLSLISKFDYELKKIMESVFVYLEKWYLQLRNLNFDGINESYLKNMFRINETSEFEKDGKKMLAKIINVSENGFLSLETEDGKRSDHDIKEIKLIY